MGRRCCGEHNVKKGLWSPDEDDKLIKHVTTHGHGSWSSVPRHAGLERCCKSCRMRWRNYLRPELKRGSFTSEEEQIIIDVHRILGNRWAQIAKHLGRTDNEVKNFWNSSIKKKLVSQGLDPQTHNLISSHNRSAASNKIAGSNTKSQPHIDQKRPVLFTVNNISQLIDSSTEINYSISQPIVPVSSAQPPTVQPIMATPTDNQYLVQNPNSGWTSVSDIFPDITLNISSASSSTEFGHLDDSNCIWAAGAEEAEPFEVAPRAMDLQGEQSKGQVVQVQQEKDKFLEIQMKAIQDMDISASFDQSSIFDFSLVEYYSTLMSGVMPKDQVNYSG